MSKSLTYEWIAVTCPNCQKVHGYLRRSYGYVQDCDCGYHAEPPAVEEDFYVCPQHIRTDGYESCCACEGDRLCTEATQ